MGLGRTVALASSCLLLAACEEAAPLIVFKDPLFYWMACFIAAGLGLGTVLTLVVPVLYSLFFPARGQGGGAREPVPAET